MNHLVPPHPLKGWGTEQHGKPPETEWVPWGQAGGLTKASVAGGGWEKQVWEALGPTRRGGGRWWAWETNVHNQSTKAHPQTGVRCRLGLRHPRQQKNSQGDNKGGR